MTKKIFLFLLVAPQILLAAPLRWDLGILIGELQKNDSFIFCNSHLGKFDIRLNSQNELRMDSLIYKNLLNSNKWTKNEPCEYLRPTNHLICRVDSLRKLSVDLDFVVEKEARDRVGDQGDRFELTAVLSTGLGPIRTDSDDEVSCQIQKR